MKRLFLTLLLTVGVACFQLSRVLADGNNWMSTVDGNTYVSRMSIPGAHDAGTGHGFTGNLSSYGARFATTQSLTITQQWNAGVRAFDLRPALLSGNDNGNADVYSDLYIWHGIIRTPQTLQTALQTLCDLLDANPTETAIVIMRHETDAYYNIVFYKNEVSDQDTKFDAKLNSLLTKDNKIKSHALANFNADMKLADARGKLIILMRDRNTPVGGRVTGWGDRKAPFLGGGNAAINNQSSFASYLFVQDYYDTSASGAADAKKADFQRLLQYTTQEQFNDAVWTINESSGYNATTSVLSQSFPASTGYASNATTQNAAAVAAINATTAGHTGIVLMDYAGVNSASVNGSTYSNLNGLNLVNAIIAQNTKPGYTSDDYEEYHRALASIPNGAQRIITTTIDGTKYYLKADGYLTSSLSDAGKFTFTHTMGGNWSGGCYGMLIDNGNGQHFTNGNNGGVINDSGHLNVSTNSRAGWETQLFFQNAEGKYAIRACNVDAGDNWYIYGSAYWDVKNGTNAGYTDQRNYIWEVEEAPVSLNITYTIVHDGKTLGTLTKEQFTGSATQLPERYLNAYNTTYSYSIDTVDAEHTAVTVTVDWSNLPFRLTPSYGEATWYYLLGQASYAGYYISTNGDNVTWGEGSQDTDAYKWAFMGDPVIGIKMVNKATGATKFLTNNAPANMTTTEYAWPMRKQTANYANVGSALPFLFLEPDRKQYLNVYSNSQNLNYWSSTDQGSTFWIEPIQEIAYNIIYNDEILRTVTVRQTVGDAPCVPAELGVPFATYTYDVEAITASTTVVNATVVSIDLPFRLSTDFADATWYYLRCHDYPDGYAFTDGDGASWGFVRQRDPRYHWAFFGNAIDGIRLVNRATGATKNLIFDENATMSTTAYAWGIKEQTAFYSEVGDHKGFGLYNGSAYLNAYINTGTNVSELLTWNSLDQGSTFWVDEVFDVDVKDWFEHFGHIFQLKPDVVNSNRAKYEAALQGYTYEAYQELAQLVNNEDNLVLPQTAKVRIKNKWYGTYLGASEVSLMGNMPEEQAAEVTLTGNGEGKYSMKIGDLYVQGATRSAQVTLGSSPVYFTATMLTPVNASFSDTDAYTDYTFLHCNGSGSVVGWWQPASASVWCVEAMDEVGDINYDGQITIADVTALVNIVLGKDDGATPVYNHNAADVNLDGSVTIADVTALVNIVLGK